MWQRIPCLIYSIFLPSPIGMLWKRHFGCGTLSVYEESVIVGVFVQLKPFSSWSQRVGFAIVTSAFHPHAAMFTSILLKVSWFSFKKKPEYTLQILYNEIENSVVFSQLSKLHIWVDGKSYKGLVMFESVITCKEIKSWFRSWTRIATRANRELKPQRAFVYLLHTDT